VFTYILPGAVVVCAGMGTVRATLAVQTALKLADVSMLLSVGLAGGCHPEVRVGSVVEAGTVVDTLSGERFTAASGGTATLATTHTIASVREKERLFASYGADVVDMEAATVARLAAMRGLPFRAIKAVSDGHDFELNSLARFASPHGHFRTRAFALHTALRPRQWRKTMQLGAASRRALAALTLVLKGL
jgi:adenosylhomocysteine nucleosidase